MIRLQRLSNGEILDLDTSAPLGSGGEAHVYEVPGHPDLVAKVYHRPTEAYASKLACMVASAPDDPMSGLGHTSIAWPVDVLRKPGSGGVVGYLMPRITGMRSVLEFYSPSVRRRRAPLFHYRYLHRTARNLAAAIQALHLRGYVVGDVREANVLVQDTALVTLVDTDSFQVRDPGSGVVYRCPVGTPEFTPPELQGKNFREVDRGPEHDLFGLAVLIFQLLMEGGHPFAGVYTGHGDPPPSEDRIRAGHFALGKRVGVPYRPSPNALPFDAAHPALRMLFVRCFEDGHLTPAARPDAASWQAALEEAEDALICCRRNEQHYFGGHLPTCPWCRRIASLRVPDPFPSPLDAQGQSTPVQSPLPPAGAQATGAATLAAARAAYATADFVRELGYWISTRVAPVLGRLFAGAGAGTSQGVGRAASWWADLLAGVPDRLDRASGLALFVVAFLLFGIVRAWCGMAAPGAVGIPRELTPFCRFLGAGVLRIGWGVLRQRLSAADLRTAGFGGSVLLTGFLGMLAGFIPFVWLPMSVLDTLLQPLTSKTGPEAAWGIAGAVAVLAVTTERRAAAGSTGVPRLTRALAGCLAAGLGAGHLAPHVRLPAWTQPLAAPSDIRASGNGEPHQALVSWVDNSLGEQAFVLERSTDGAGFKRIARLRANATLFVDPSVRSGTNYYRIKAVNLFGESPYSGISGFAAAPPATASTPAPSTTAPASGGISPAPGTPSTGSVTGRVTLDGVGVEGAVVTAGPSSAISASDGTYRLDGLPAGSLLVNIAKAGVTFPSPSRSVQLDSGQTIGLDFGAARTYTLAGQVVTPDGQGVPDVLVRGGTLEARTGSDGTFTIPAMPAGVYSVAPAREGYVFRPPSALLRVTGDLTGVRFLAGPVTYRIGGRITAMLGAGYGGARVVAFTADGNPAGAAVSARDGRYIMALPAGAYRLGIAAARNVRPQPSERPVVVPPEHGDADFFVDIR